MKIRNRYKINEIVTMTNVALKNYGEEYRNVPLTICSFAVSTQGHPGFDESVGTALYDFYEINFSLYEWEFK